MGPRCSSAETQVCHRSYIIAANFIPNLYTQYIYSLSLTQSCHSTREQMTTTTTFNVKQLTLEDIIGKQWFNI
jgi:hypothetical protein